MTEEEKKAIEYLENRLDILHNNIQWATENSIKVVLNLIDKQQEEIEDLKEDNKSYKYILDMQNKREYRSKFLKDFQKENGKNMLPDYDEIYKRYDKQKEEIERLKNAEEYAKLGKETLLDTIHKQEKEIEELKQGIEELKEINASLLWQRNNIDIPKLEDFNNHYISKDKIRNLLPKINGSISHFKSKNDNHIVKRIKRMLEDLLEEK